MFGSSSLTCGNCSLLTPLKEKKPATQKQQNLGLIPEAVHFGALHL